MRETMKETSFNLSGLTKISSDVAINYCKAIGYEYTNEDIDNIVWWNNYYAEGNTVIHWDIYQQCQDLHEWLRLKDLEDVEQLARRCYITINKQ